MHGTIKDFKVFLLTISRHFFVVLKKHGNVTCHLKEIGNKNRSDLIVLYCKLKVCIRRKVRFDKFFVQKIKLKVYPKWFQTLRRFFIFNHYDN